MPTTPRDSLLESHKLGFDEIESPPGFFPSGVLSWKKESFAGPETPDPQPGQQSQAYCPCLFSSQGIALMPAAKAILQLRAALLPSGLTTWLPAAPWMGFFVFLEFPCCKGMKWHGCWPGSPVCVPGRSSLLGQEEGEG